MYIYIYIYVGVSSRFVFRGMKKTSKNCLPHQVELNLRTERLPCNFNRPTPDGVCGVWVARTKRPRFIWRFGPVMECTSAWNRVDRWKWRLEVRSYKPDPPRGAKWMAKGAMKQPLRVHTPPLGGCWYN